MKNIKPSQAIYVLGMIGLFISIFMKEILLGFWIALATLILSSAVYLIEVKRMQNPNREAVRKKMVLFGVSICVLIGLGWFIF